MKRAALQSLLPAHGLSELSPFLQDSFMDSLRHGDFQRWRALARQLPDLRPSQFGFDTVVTVGREQDADPASLDALQQGLRQLIPWRKGPWSLFGIDIDSEWRSDLKWDRLSEALGPLTGQTVLDVGCGNGYHCYRMHGMGAELSLGLEPHLPYVGQFAAINRYLPETPVHVLPLALEQLPDCGPVFDTVFSMGVLYHARSPLDHLLRLQKCLKPGGQLLLESIVVPGETGYALTPTRRYARMANVWFVPTTGTIQRWLIRCGFQDVRLLHEGPTTADEQRQTEWMPFDSLEASLQEGSDNLTVEGYPAPRRAVFLASQR